MVQKHKKKSLHKDKKEYRVSVFFFLSKMSTSLQELYVYDPTTGRPIRVGGPTWEKRYANRDPKTFRFAYTKPPRKRKPKKTPLSPQHMREILAMSLHQPIPLSELREETTQPFLRRRLKTQIRRKGEGRGSRTRGWAAAAPQRGRPRKELMKKCGRKCFLYPEQLKFPICRKCYQGKCDCAIDCRGVTAAKVRAREWKYPQIAEAATEIERQKCLK